MRPKPRLIYLAHPFGGQAKNLDRAAQWLAGLNDPTGPARFWHNVRFWAPVQILRAR